MKSFCKHCGQEYDDLPEEYLNQEVTCGSCGQNYVVIKTVDCIYCGAPNEPDTSQCRGCGHALKQKSPSVPKLQPRYRDAGYVKTNSEKPPEPSKVEDSEVLCNVSAFDKVGINIYASLTIFFGVISIVFAPLGCWLGPLMFDTVDTKPLKRRPTRFEIGCITGWGILQVLSPLVGLYKCASVPLLFLSMAIWGSLNIYFFFKFCVIYKARLDAGEVESEDVDTGYNRIPTWIKPILLILIALVSLVISIGLSLLSQKPDLWLIYYPLILSSAIAILLKLTLGRFVLLITAWLIPVTWIVLTVIILPKGAIESLNGNIGKYQSFKSHVATGDSDFNDREWQSFLSYVTEEESKRADKWESKISSKLSYFEFANILERDILPHYRNILNRCNSLNVSKLNESRKKDYVRIASGTRQQIEGCEEIIKGVRSNDEHLVEKGLQLLKQASSQNSNR